MDRTAHVASNSRGVVRTLIGAVAGMALVVSLAAGESIRDPHEHFFQETFGDFTEELELAREEGKKGVCIFFEMDECPFCERMRETVLNQTDVQDYFRENFRIFTVDIEGDTEVVDFEGNEMPAKDFARRINKVRATPVIGFYDLEGRLVVRFTGAVRNREEFLRLGEFVADGYYRTTNFTRFKRAKQAAQSEAPAR